MEPKKLRVGIVGCGRAAQKYYLPACLRISEIQVTGVVDVVLSQAKAVAAKNNIQKFTDRYQDLLDLVDAVVLVIPHYLHARVATEFLERGISVLTEKPMATSYEDASRMLAASQHGGAALAVSLVRRFYPGSRLAKALVEQGFLGKLQRIDAEDGFIPSRPPSAQWLYDKQKAGGGVLISDGIHVLDLVLWICGGEATVGHYEDDGFSGVEANAYLDLELAHGTDKVPASLRFSVARELRNTIIIRGERGTIELPVQRGSYLRAKLADPAGQSISENLVISPETGADMSEVHYFSMQLRSFISDVTAGRVGFTSGAHHLMAMRLIDGCYSSKNHALQPWEAVRSFAAPHNTEPTG